MSTVTNITLHHPLDRCSHHVYRSSYHTAESVDGRREPSTNQQLLRRDQEQHRYHGITPAQPHHSSDLED